MHARRAVIHLEDLRPEPGDIIALTRSVDEAHPSGTEFREIASLGADGQLYFRGGPGLRARPHQVHMFARRSDPGYQDAAYRARQRAAAHMKHPERLGSGRVTELTKWRVTGEPTVAAALALEDALGVAANERPMQKVLEQHREILAHLVTGHKGIYVIPQVQLGKQYVPDFLIAAETSLGLQWTLVELESPTAPLVIADGQAAQQLRKAIKQITDWREWLGNNADYARRSIKDDGLGLPGIRVDAQGLVIIGREDPPETTNAMRLRALNDQKIQIRTYDWLLRASRARRGISIGVLDAEMPSSANDAEW
jgi:hypothetical protein